MLLWALVKSIEAIELACTFLAKLAWIHFASLNWQLCGSAGIWLVQPWLQDQLSPPLYTALQSPQLGADPFCCPLPFPDPSASIFSPLGTFSLATPGFYSPGIGLGPCKS